MPAGALAGGAVAGLGSMFGASEQADAALEAAQLQYQSTQDALAQQKQQFGIAQKGLNPYILGGQSAYKSLQSQLPTLTKAFTPEYLENTPGYKFLLDQGMKASQNSYSAQGLANSGAALKGGINFAEGLAGTTYNQQLQNYLAQNQQAYNMLAGASQIGSGAASALGGQAVAAGQGEASSLIQGGNALAAGVNTAGAAYGQLYNTLGGLGGYGLGLGNNNGLLSGAGNNSWWANLPKTLGAGG